MGRRGQERLDVTTRCIFCVTERALSKWTCSLSRHHEDRFKQTGSRRIACPRRLTVPHRAMLLEWFPWCFRGLSEFAALLCLAMSSGYVQELDIAQSAPTSSTCMRGRKVAASCQTTTYLRFCLNVHTTSG